MKNTIVEIIEVDNDGEPKPSDLITLPGSVRINGTDVGLIAEDGIKINPGHEHEPATVTLTLMPTQIIIGRAQPDSDEEPLSPNKAAVFAERERRLADG